MPPEYKIWDLQPLPVPKPRFSRAIPQPDVDYEKFRFQNLNKRKLSPFEELFSDLIDDSLIRTKKKLNDSQKQRVIEICVESAMEEVQSLKQTSKSKSKSNKKNISIFSDKGENMIDDVNDILEALENVSIKDIVMESIEKIFTEDNNDHHLVEMEIPKIEEGPQVLNISEIARKRQQKFMDSIKDFNSLATERLTEHIKNLEEEQHQAFKDKLESAKTGELYKMSEEEEALFKDRQEKVRNALNRMPKGISAQYSNVPGPEGTTLRMLEPLPIPDEIDPLLEVQPETPPDLVVPKGETITEADVDRLLSAIDVDSFEVDLNPVDALGTEHFAQSELRQIDGVFDEMLPEEGDFQIQKLVSMISEKRFANVIEVTPDELDQLDLDVFEDSKFTVERVPKDLQSRLTNMWEALLMPLMQRLDFMVKYTSSQFFHRLREILLEWEHAVVIIVQREATLSEITTIFQQAKDEEQREIPMKSYPRLQALFTSLSKLTNQCTQHLTSIFSQTGDVVTWGGRPYLLKTRVDVNEVLTPFKQLVDSLEESFLFTCDSGGMMEEQDEDGLSDLSD
ncbi:hypothetical protein PCE1_000284 [Barthelona sp. PCE]